MTLSTEQINRNTLNALAKSADTFDISYSVTEQGTEERMLVGWNAANASLLNLSKVASDWGFSQQMLTRWLDDANDSDIVGITVNKALTSFRLYTHHWNRTKPSDVGAIIYRGYKALADGSSRIDDYTYLGDLRESENFEFAINNSRHPEWLSYVVDKAPNNLPLVYSRIVNTGRSSWLATVKNAEIDAGDVISESLRGRKLLHLAGGMDATKGGFDTFYLSADAQDFTKFIL